MLLNPPFSDSPIRSSEPSLFPVLSPILLVIFFFFKRQIPSIGQVRSSDRLQTWLKKVQFPLFVFVDSGAWDG